MKRLCHLVAEAKVKEPLGKVMRDQRSPHVRGGQDLGQPTCFLCLGKQAYMGSFLDFFLLSSFGTLPQKNVGNGSTYSSMCFLLPLSFPAALGLVCSRAVNNPVHKLSPTIFLQPFYNFVNYLIIISNHPFWMHHLFPCRSPDSFIRVGGTKRLSK